MKTEEHSANAAFGPEAGALAERFAPRDMEAIRQPLASVGINYYTRNLSRIGAPLDPVESGKEVTDIGWEVFAGGLTELLLRLQVDYRLPPLYVTESGAACRDRLVDYATQRRTLKDSALWYRAFCFRDRTAGPRRIASDDGARQ